MASYMGFLLINLCMVIEIKLAAICVWQEVLRVKAEHPDDDQSVSNDRVKGQLKVTRAFGAGFLKKVG